MVLGELLIFYRGANCNLQRNYAAAPNCVVRSQLAASTDRKNAAHVQPGCMNVLEEKRLGLSNLDN
jgi:hypothetical protein